MLVVAEMAFGRAICLYFFCRFDSESALEIAVINFSDRDHLQLFWGPKPPVDPNPGSTGLTTFSEAVKTYLKKLPLNFILKFMQE